MASGRGGATRRIQPALAAFLAVSGCAAHPPVSTASYARTVAQVQAAYRAAELAVAAEILRGGLSPIQAEQVRVAETAADPVVARLSAASSPETVVGLLGRAAALQAALPPDQVPPDVHAALAEAQAAVLAYQRAAAPGWAPLGGA